MFEGRTIVIASQHKKEIVISPILKEALGVKCIISKNLDTDQLGTFTGEIERIDDPLITARKKCILAMELTGCDMAIASEGSFGPHPTIFFVPADDELLLFVDKKNNLEIISREISTETNFNTAEIISEKQLKEFAAHSLFPSHALIIRKSKDESSEIIKGITDQTTLTKIFNQFISGSNSVFVETDMRAMHNPLRMKVIEKAAHKLVNKINSQCPQCKTPGFEMTEAKPGLPCERCNFPTNSTLYYIYQCKKCNFKKEDKYPHSKTKEEPLYCDICNP